MEPSFSFLSSGSPFRVLCVFRGLTIPFSQQSALFEPSNSRSYLPFHLDRFLPGFFQKSTHFLTLFFAKRTSVTCSVNTGWNRCSKRNKKDPFVTLGNQQTLGKMGFVTLVRLEPRLPARGGGKGQSSPSPRSRPVDNLTDVANSRLG